MGLPASSPGLLDRDRATAATAPRVCATGAP